MATYNSQTIANYNANPPPDDGTQSADNEVTWGKHKVKLADPIKTLAEAINTELLTYTAALQAEIDAIQGVTTGDMKWLFKSTPATGWLVLNGDSIGDSGSGATFTGSTYEDLYTFLWTNVSDTYAPVSTGRGASAAADWAAGKTLTMPDASDRALMGVGTTFTESGFTTDGTSTLVADNIPAHTHDAGTLATNSAGAHTHTITTNDQSTDGNGAVRSSAGGGTGYSASGAAQSNGAHTHTLTGATGSTGSGTAFDVVPKGLGGYVHIKL